MCGGACTDLTTDMNNCGACGLVCSSTPPSTAACINGRCLVTLASLQGYPTRIAVDATSVYWTNHDPGAMMKLPIAGGTPSALASGENGPWGIAVDSTSVYWTNSNESGTVMKLPIDGGTPVTLASGQSYPDEAHAEVARRSPASRSATTDAPA